MAPEDLIVFITQTQMDGMEVQVLSLSCPVCAPLFLILYQILVGASQHFFLTTTTEMWRTMTCTVQRLVLMCQFDKDIVIMCCTESYLLLSGREMR